MRDLWTQFLCKSRSYDGRWLDLMGLYQDQIDASVKDAVKLARSRLPDGGGLSHCAECDTVIPTLAEKLFPAFAYVSVVSRNSKKSRRIPPASTDEAAKTVS